MGALLIAWTCGSVEKRGSPTPPVQRSGAPARILVQALRNRLVYCASAMRSIVSELVLSSPNHAVAAEIRRLGRAFTPEILQATYRLYTPYQQRAPKDGVSVHKDLAYGPDERHRLDVFVPTKAPAKAPIVAYFHGGGYVAGERSPLPGLIYDNVPIFFARHGFIGVNATYRLAPR